MTQCKLQDEQCRWNVSCLNFLASATNLSAAPRHIQPASVNRQIIVPNYSLWYIFASISQRLLKMIVHHDFCHCRNAMRELLSCVEYLLYWIDIKHLFYIYVLKSESVFEFLAPQLFLYGMELELELHVPNCYTLIFIWNFQISKHKIFITFIFDKFKMRHTLLTVAILRVEFLSIDCIMFRNALFEKKKHSTPEFNVIKSQLNFKCKSRTW